LKKTQEKYECIKNKELRNFVSYKLGKNDFSEKELSQIHEIIIDGKTISGKKNEIYFDEIGLFSNLKEIKIRNAHISSGDIKKIKNIDTVIFDRCVIEDISALDKVVSLSIANTNIDNIEEIKNFKNIENLELININIENFNFLRELPILKKLALKNIPGLNWNKINFNLPIEYLSIEDVDNIPLSSILKFENLNTLSIEMNKRIEWEEFLLNLKSKGIKILLNEIYEY